MPGELKAQTEVDTTPDAGATAERASAPLEVICPADGQVIARLPIDGQDDVRAKAAQLRAAQPEWEAIGPDGRRHLLLAWLDWIFDNERHLREVLQREAGKSWGDTGLEIAGTADVINYYAKHAGAFLAPRHPRPHGPMAASKRLTVRPRPYALVGVLSPWNYPLAMPMLDIPGALMAGAAVLSKPSEFTPLCWLELVRGFEEAGAPPVLSAVVGGPETGAALVDAVDMVQFTGSSRTGRKIAVAAAERLIPCSLELGGKDAMIVLDDADVDRAVGAAIWGGLYNAGQSCMAVERVYVARPVYDGFVGKLVERVSKLRVGMDEPGSFSSDFGALANDAQMAIVERHVAEAVGKGARALTGGHRHPAGLFYEPTVLVDVDHTMACMTEETFGPLIPVMPFDELDEAIELANDSPYGLSGSVFSRNSERAHEVAARMTTGAVNVNDVMINALQIAAPQGGWGESGIGSRSGGAHGILKYCRDQVITDPRVTLPTELQWYPVTSGRSTLMARAVRLLGAHGWRRRLGLRVKR